MPTHLLAPLSIMPYCLLASPGPLTLRIGVASNLATAHQHPPTITVKYSHNIFLVPV